MKNITIISSKYPNVVSPSDLVFVQQLAWTLADMGISCSIICPIAKNIEIKKHKILPKETIEYTDSGNSIKIYYPRFIGFGQQDLKVFNTSRLTLIGFNLSVSRIFREMSTIPDIVYGHFISPSGVTASRIGKQFNIPSFLAYGESSPWSIKNLGIVNVQRELQPLKGVISVSTKNKNDLINLNIVDEEKIGVFPNGYRPERFFPRDKMEAREKLNLPKDKFIVSFVGQYSDRKGINRLEAAIDGLEDVYFISAGKGKLEPTSKKCLFSGTVKNEDLPFFYSASDVFVLPTLNEGCSNAIIEAMASGLPIISSELDFNKDILDDSNSLRVNPESISELRQAINQIKADYELRDKFKKGSLKKAKHLTLRTRAMNIINFMDSKLN